MDIHRKNRVNVDLRRLDVNNQKPHRIDLGKPDRNNQELKKATLAEPNINNQEPKKIIPSGLKEKSKMIDKKSLMAIIFFVATIGIFIAIFAKIELKKDQKELDDKLKKVIPRGVAIPMGNSSEQNQAQVQNQTQQQQQQTETTPAPQNDILSQETEEKTEEVKEENLKYEKSGISFEYPKDYRIEERNEQIVAVKDGDQWRMKIYSNKDKKEIEDWYKGYFPEKDNDGCEFSDASLKIGSYSTKLVKLKSDSEDEAECKDSGYFALNDKKTKAVRVRLEKASEDEAGKILDKFKFIN
ncbi:MAG TPA: hypothetical protein PLK35_00670 [Candidatus Moranbacteria bacterium]|nr:hypothetical protein [Candidatus Moranbacteria bacterium]